jgi:hypothetical protein
VIAASAAPRAAASRAAPRNEGDPWRRYNELGGVNGGNSAYIAALQNLDEDMPQYVSDNTDDEVRPRS